MKTAIVGLGGISLEHLEKLGRLDQVEVAGVCDLSPTLVEAVADRFGVAGRYTDYAAMLAELRPDAVHVLTPPASHVELTLAAFEAGAHVLVEKPAAPTLADYLTMRDAAQAVDRLLIENYNYRTMPVVERALAEVQEGTLGTVVNVDVAWGVGIAAPGSAYLDPSLRHFAHDLPGGALRNVASHPASIVSAFVGGAERVSVSLRRLTEASPGSDELRALIAAGPAAATLTLTSHGNPPLLTLRVQCTHGTLDADVLGGRLQLERAGSPLTRVVDGLRGAADQAMATGALVTRTATGRNYWYVGFERLLERFYAAIAGHGPPPIPSAEMDDTNRLVEALFDPGNQL